MLSRVVKRRRLTLNGYPTMVVERYQQFGNNGMVTLILEWSEMRSYVRDSLKRPIRLQNKRNVRQNVRRHGERLVSPDELRTPSSRERRVGNHGEMLLIPSSCASFCVSETAFAEEARFEHAARYIIELALHWTSSWQDCPERSCIVLVYFLLSRCTDIWQP